MAFFSVVAFGFSSTFFVSVFAVGGLGISFTGFSFAAVGVSSGFFLSTVAVVGSLASFGLSLVFCDLVSCVVVVGLEGCEMVFNGSSSSLGIVAGGGLDVEAALVGGVCSSFGAGAFGCCFGGGLIRTRRFGATKGSSRLMASLSAVCCRAIFGFSSLACCSALFFCCSMASYSCPVKSAYSLRCMGFPPLRAIDCITLKLLTNWGYLDSSTCFLYRSHHCK